MERINDLYKQLRKHFINTPPKQMNEEESNVFLEEIIARMKQIQGYMDGNIVLNDYDGARYSYYVLFHEQISSVSECWLEIAPSLQYIINEIGKEYPNVYADKIR